MSWADQPLWGFDTETSGLDPKTCRLVSASLVRADTADGVSTRNWLINPGVPIPEEASAVHSITDGMVTDAMPEATAIKEIVIALYEVWDSGAAICVYNAPYDMTVVEYALARHGHATLTERGIGPVIDPLCLDRVMDRYRAGKRTLSANTSAYAVSLGDAHKAEHDATATARLAWKYARDFPVLRTLDVVRLQELQRRGHAAWARNYESYRRRRLGERNAKIDGSWPYVAAPDIFPVRTGVPI